MKTLSRNPIEPFRPFAQAVFYYSEPDWSLFYFTVRDLWFCTIQVRQTLTGNELSPTQQLKISHSACKRIRICTYMHAMGGPLPELHIEVLMRWLVDMLSRLSDGICSDTA